MMKPQQVFEELAANPNRNESAYTSAMDNAAISVRLGEVEVWSTDWYALITASYAAVLADGE